MLLPKLELCGAKASLLAWNRRRLAWEVVDFDHFMGFRIYYNAWQYLPADPVINLKVTYTKGQLKRCLALAKDCWGRKDGDTAALYDFLGEFDCYAQDELVDRIREKFGS